MKGKEGLSSKKGASSLDGHQCSGCGGESGEDWRSSDRTLMKMDTIASTKGRDGRRERNYKEVKFIKTYSLFIIH